MNTSPRERFSEIIKGENLSEEDHFRMAFSPEDARELLKLNTHNRPIHDSIVYKYATEIQEGRWRYNGEAFKISRTGVLLDGQHRALALSLCDESARIEALFITGLEDEVQSSMDIGANRSLPDILSLAGISEMNKTLASAIRLFYIWEHNLLFAESKIIAAQASKTALTAWSLKNPSIVEILRAASNYKDIPVRKGILMAIYAKVVLTQHTDAAINEFFGRLDSGADLEAGSPILSLRNRLVRIKIEGERISDRDQIGMIVNTFNHWRSGRRISKIQLPHGGSWNKGNFPTITRL